MKPIRLDGRSLNRAQVAEIAHGAPVSLDPEQMRAVQPDQRFEVGLRRGAIANAIQICLKLRCHVAFDFL